MKPILWKGLVASLLLALAAQPVTAKNRDKSWELSFFGGTQIYEGDADLDNPILFGSRIGYNFTHNHELELSLSLFQNNEFSNTNMDVDATFVDLNYVFNLNTNKHFGLNDGRWAGKDRWVPYFTMGLGNAGLSVEGAGSESQQQRGAEAQGRGRGFSPKFILEEVAGVRKSVSRRCLWVDLGWLFRLSPHDRRPN